MSLVRAQPGQPELFPAVRGCALVQKDCGQMVRHRTRRVGEYGSIPCGQVTLLRDPTRFVVSGEHTFFSTTGGVSNEYKQTKTLCKTSEGAVRVNTPATTKGVKV